MTAESSPTLPDILAPNLAVVFCGINPGATSALAGHPFLSATNRFWRVLHDAGFTPHQLRPEDAASILRYHCGITAAVARPTRKADDLTRQEMRAASGALEAKIRHFAPQVVAFLGKAAVAAMTDVAEVAWGRQPEHFCGAISWVLPNPSGRNRRFRTDDLVQAYRELRESL